MAGLKLNQHKVFTRNGWKSYEDYLLGTLKIGEDVLIFNPNDKHYEWSPLLGIDFNPHDKKILLSILNKNIEFGTSQSWLVDVEYPQDLKINNKYGLIGSNTLSNIDSKRDSFGITWNKHSFYIQAGLIDLDLDLDKNTITPYKESNFTINPLTDYMPTWCPITLYYNALVLTEELIILVGCFPNNHTTSGSTHPYALSRTLITSSPINLSKFNALTNDQGLDITQLEVINLSSSQCYLCSKEGNEAISLPAIIPYEGRDAYEVRGNPYVPNGLVCTFKVRDLGGNLSPNEGKVRVFRHGDEIHNPDVTPNPTPFPINPYDIVTKDTANTSGGYLQLDSMSYVPPSIKVRWESLIDIPTIKIDWEDINNKPILRISWDEIERLPSHFPTSWELIHNRPNAFPTAWEYIANRPEAFPPLAHSHPEYALKLHTHTTQDFPELGNVVKIGDSIGLLENTLGYITIEDITKDLVKSLLTSSDGIISGINADTLGHLPPAYFTNASNITTGIIGTHRLPLFTGGDVSSLINPTHLVLSETGVIPGTYTKLSVDEKGRILMGDSLIPSDIPDLDASKITSGIFNTTLLPLASTTEPGIVYLSNSFYDTDIHTVPSISVIKALYEIVEKLVPLSYIGIPTGIPSLDEQGFIPISQLPPSLDEIIYVDTSDQLPNIGESNYLYIVKSTQEMFLWDSLTFKSINSNPTSIPKLDTPRKISTTGDAAWSVLFDGTQDVSNILTLTPTGVTPNTYTKVRVDPKGRVEFGTTLISSDLPFIDGGFF